MPERTNTLDGRSTADDTIEEGLRRRGVLREDLSELFTRESCRAIPYIVLEKPARTTAAEIPHP
jgi:hypothetical protein